MCIARSKSKNAIVSSLMTNIEMHELGTETPDDDKIVVKDIDDPDDVVTGVFR